MQVKTINDFLKNSAAKWPDKVAVIKGGQGMTYKEDDKRNHRKWLTGCPFSAKM